MLLLALSFLALLGSSLDATTVQRFDLEELTENAEVVFMGTCQSASTEQVGGQVFTRYRFAVAETLKGGPRQNLELLLPGGRFEGTRIRIPGMPAFAPGEELVLFLTVEGRPGYAWPVGLGQGKFRIERRGAAKPARIYQELDGLSFYTPAAKPAPAGSTPLQGIPLDQFLGQVRALITPPAVSHGKDDGR
jgi:hypothetical protein